MKKISALLLAGALALTLAACGGGDGGSDNAGGGVSAYTVETAELDPKVYPDDYPLIPFDEFEASFEKMKAANLNGELESYQDIAEVFGVDGAYYKNNDFKTGSDVFKYYGWYADNGANVLLTFKADGNKLEYFAYTSDGVN